MLNLANALTLSRFAAAPVFMYLVLSMNGENSHYYGLTATVLLILTLLTDMFDGMAARKLNIVTDFGKIMDPVADSTFFMTALFSFSASTRFAVPIWLPVIVLYREVAMHVLRRYAALSGLVVAAKFSGKLKMVVQSVLTSLLLVVFTASDFSLFGIKLTEETIRSIAFWTVLVIAVVNVLSMIEYLRGVPALAERLKERRAAENKAKQ